MMELPNFSRQLLLQLGHLRNEGLFCDCTILVGDSQHRAHKVVLAASSMLFRSLLDSSDTISIDTTVVSTQEFDCLLDMIYTGKLPLGKHNVSRVMAAAESLQMFDLAVGFKNVLTTLVNQKADTANISVQPRRHAIISSVSTVNPEGSASPSNDDSTSNKMEMTDEIKKRSCDFGEDEDMEPACKRTCQERSDSSGLEEAKSSGCVAEEISSSAVKVSGEAAGALFQHSSQVVELLSNMPSVLELLSQAAQSSLDEPDRQIVCECCEGTDPSSVLEQLMSRLKDGRISERVLLQLLRAVEQKAPSSFPALLQSLLEDVEKETHRAEVNSKQQDDIRSEQNPEQEVGVDGSKERTEEEEEEEEEKEEEKSPNTTAESSSSTSSHSKSYVCRWCKKTFEYKCRMLAHVKRCSMSQECELQCPHCPEKLASQRAMRRHWNEAHRNTIRVKKKVACDLCGRTFAHPSGLVYHRQTEHFEEKPFACKECGTKFGANSSLKNHMRLHTGEKPYHCQHCDMSFTVAAALSYHTKKKHSEGKMYVCQYCKAVFAQSIELTRHVRTHTGDRPYVCRECGKGYSQASGLTVHLQTFHSLSEPHDCKKCCLSFSSLETHQQHIQEFHPKEFHKCSTCNKVFPSSALLDKHKVTHTGSKPFSCQLCNKSYQQLSGLWYHNRTNHPEVFASQTQQLKTLLQCDLCFKFFPSAASLAKHQAAEHQASASSAVCCLNCKVELDGSDKVQEHVCSQHVTQSGEAFSCPLCSLICISPLELQEHLLSCHIETQQEPENGEKEQASTSYTVISSDSVVDREDKHKLNMVSKKINQQEASPHVLVALTSGESRSSGEVLEVNMYDLLNRSVTFIYDNQGTSPDS